MSVRAPRTRALAAGLAVVLCALCAPAPAIALGLPGSDLVRTRLEAALASAVKGAATVGKVTLHPLGGSIEVEGVTLQPGTGALTKLTIRHGTLRLDLGELIRGRLRIRGITADDLAVDLLATGGPERARRPLFGVEVLSELEQLEVTNGVVHYENRPVRFALDVRGIHVASESAPNGVAGTVTLGPLWFRTGDVPVQHVDRAVLRWGWSAPRIAFEILEATGPSGTFRGNGLVSFTSAGVLLRGHLSGTAELTKVLADPNAPVRGQAHAEADFRLGDPGDTEIWGTLAGVGPLQVMGLTCQDTSAAFRIGPAGVALTDGRGVTTGGTRVEDFAYRRAKDDSWTIHAAGDADVQDLLRYIKAGRRAEQLRGRARFTVDAVADAGGAAPRWSVGADLAASGIVRGGIAGRVTGAGDVNGARIELAGRLDRADMNVTFRWPKGGLAEHWWVDAHLAAAAGEPAATARLDVLRYLEDENIELPQGTLPYAGGAFVTDVHLEGRGNDLVSGDIPFRVERPTYGTVPLSSLEGRVRIGARGLWSVDFRLVGDDANGLTGSIHGAPRAPAELEADVTGLPLAVAREYLMGAFDVRLPAAEGTLRGFARGRLAWGQREISVGATLSGRVADLPPGEVQLAARVVGDEAEIRLGHLVTDGIVADFTGRIALPGGARPWGIAGQLSAEADLRRFGLAAGLVDTAGLVHLTGDVSFDGIDRPLLANGLVSWHGVEVAGAALPDGAGRLAPLADGTLFELDTSGWSGGLRVTGPVQDPSLAAHLAWTDLPVLEFITALTRKPVGLAMDVRSDGTLDLGGRLRDPAGWKGRATITRFDGAGAMMSGRLEKTAALDFLGDGYVRTPQDQPVVFSGVQGGRVRLDGSVGVFGAAVGALDLHVDGDADLSLIEIFDPDLVGAGRITANVTLGGTAKTPRITGQLKIVDGRIRLLPYTDAIDRLQLQVDFAERLVTFSRGSFSIGGGDVTLFGTLSLNDWIPGRFDVSVRARDIALNIPKDLWGRYNADLRVTGQASNPEVSGDVTMLAGRFTQEFSFLEPMSGVRVRKVAPATSRSHWITRIGLRLHVTAADSLAIRNEMARVQAAVGLNLTGDLGQVLLDGTVVLVEGGRITFRGVDYEVARGTVTFDDPRGEPMRVQVRLTTDVRGYAIRLDLDATLESLEYQLTSTPALSQQDILYLLITGQTTEEVASAPTQAPTELATAYFGTQLGEFLLGGAAKSLFGLQRFTIAPSVVGAETRPTARVTLGRRINDRTMVLYSRDLSAEGRDLYRLEYELSRRFRVTLGRDPIGGTGVDLRWLQRFGERGGTADGGTHIASRLAGTTLNGLPAGVTIHIRRDLGLVTGQRVPRFQIVQARERLRRVLVQAGYLESQVTAREESASAGDSARSDGGSGESAVVFDVQPGPQWQIEWLGAPSAVRRTKKILGDLWAETQFRTDGLREAVRVVREALADDGFAASIVDIRLPDPAQRKLVVAVDPGPRAQVVSVSYEGVHALTVAQVSEEVLSRPQRVLSQLPGPLKNETTYRPREVADDADAIRTLYAQNGYLEAKVEERVRFRDGGAAVAVTFVIDEGPLSKIASVRVTGDWPDALGPALNRVPLKAGETFSPAGVKTAESALRQALDEAGYWQARVATRPSVEAGRVDVVFNVRAGRPAVVDEVRLEGLKRTRRKLVESAVQIVPGQPLSTYKLHRTESELFRLGVFRSVELTTVPVGDDPGRRVVIVRVAENPRLSLLATIGYDTVEKVRASVSLSNENLWGLGRTGTIQLFDSSVHSGARLTLEDRHLDHNRLEGLMTLAAERLERPGVVLRTTSYTLQIGSPARVEKRWQLRYVIEDDRVTGDLSGLEGVLPSSDIAKLETIRLGGVQGSYIVDRRDDPFLPTRGWLARADAGVWTTELASQADFWRLSGELAGYVPRGRLTLAGATRFGFAKPTRGTTIVPLSQRFYAGGPDTLRAFERDSVLEQPPSSTNTVIGGESMLVTNLEARYRVWSSLSLTLFYDVGNVWLTASDFYKGKLRKDLGLGLRYQTPVGALRLEYAWKLDRRTGIEGVPDESPGQFYLSIGEPF